MLELSDWYANLVFLLCSYSINLDFRNQTEILQRTIFIQDEERIREYTHYCELDVYSKRLRHTVASSHCGGWHKSSISLWMTRADHCRTVTVGVAFCASLLLLGQSLVTVAGNHMRFLWNLFSFGLSRYKRLSFYQSNFYTDNYFPCYNHLETTSTFHPYS